MCFHNANNSASGPGPAAGPGYAERNGSGLLESRGE
jgi:hypothetical protein